MMLDRKFFIFIVVGIGNTIFGYSVFAFFVFCGFHHALALFLATILGVLFNFKTIGVFVFKSHDNRLIFRFIGSYLLTYCLTAGSLGIIKSFGVNTYIAGGVSIPLMSVLTFILTKQFVFNRELIKC